MCRKLSAALVLENIGCRMVESSHQAEFRKRNDVDKKSTMHIFWKVFAGRAAARYTAFEEYCDESAA